MPSSQADVETTTRQLIRLRDDVDELLDHSCAAERTWSAWIAGVADVHLASARNMVHYWAIRQHDLRDVQSRLTAYGLSSLGRSEPHVQATLLAVRSAISAMLGESPPTPLRADGANDLGDGLLRLRTQGLFGPDPEHRVTRIMVTLPSSAATDPVMVRRLVERGMNVARINCAHDDADAWRSMARHVRQAAEAVGRSCLVAMDLAGPKLRTGPLEPGPRCVKLRPRRNELGEVTAPARAWLTTVEDPLDPPDAAMTSITVPMQWLDRRHDGDRLRLHDARGSRRTLVLEGRTRKPTGGIGFVVVTEKTTYLATGTVLTVKGVDNPTDVGELPPTERRLILHVGDILELTRDCSPAALTSGRFPHIGCTLPQIFDCARVGEKVMLDDGRIGGEIVSVSPDVLGLLIEHAADEGSRLRAGKGVNVPDADLPISALTDKDVTDLATVCELADLVEISFVRSPSDVLRLLEELRRLGNDSLGIVLKIETRQAFEHLPQLILVAMQRSRVGVMVARGDLAVECGYERLAELQEEILWLCEAAHLPVIWATQVLEQLAQTGHPSRAEVSDAAMSERAECVMLNKGPHVDDAVVALDDILRRMADHHYKKISLMPSLHSWHPDSAGPGVGHQIPVVGID